MGDTAATVYTIDAYRPALYPGDTAAAAAIDARMNLTGRETTEEYLRYVRTYKHAY